MPLDRNTVQRNVAEHIRQSRRTLSDKEKRAIRKQHEWIAEKVARRAAGRR